MNKLQCAACSDLHGNLTMLKKGLDYLFIAGDIVPLKIQNYSDPSKKWFKKDFIPWAEQMAEKVIVVGGNHDAWLERHDAEFREIIKGTNIIYLENQYWSDDNIEVFGTPLCKIYGRWSFMLDPDQMTKTWDYQFSEGFKGDKKKSILLSHDAPYGISDVLLGDCPWKTEEHIGNKPLRDLIKRTKPDLNLHGHLHTTNHDAEYLESTEVRCVSILDEEYKEIYQPYYFEI